MGTIETRPSVPTTTDSRKRRTRRIGIFVVAFVVSSLIGLASVWFVARAGKPTAVQSFDSKPYQAAYRAAKAIQAANQLGIDRERFDELLQNFATEVSLLPKEPESTRARAVVVGLRAILKRYKLASSLWKFGQLGLTSASGNWITDLEGLLKSADPMITSVDRLMGM
jgi:hypothetical protein